MSQNKALQNQLTILRLSMEPTAEAVNSRRHHEIQKAQTPWVWLIDADVIPDDLTFQKALQLIQSDRVQDVGLIGGTYSSHEGQSLIQKSYNHLCNLWSESRQVPLAGNMLLRRELCGEDFQLDQIPFLQEEYYLKSLCTKKGFKTLIEDIPLIHENEKTFSSILKRGISQTDSPEYKESLPWKRYVKTLTVNGFRHPLMTTFTASYLALRFVASRTSFLRLRHRRELP